MRQHLTTYKHWLLVGTLLIIASGIFSCGSDQAPSTDETVSKERKVDPQSVANEELNTELTERERELLLRANGRTWEKRSNGDIKNLLIGASDTTRALYIWNPQTGQAGLKQLQEVANDVATSGIQLSVASLEGTDARGRLIALRSSQVVLPAYIISDNVRIGNQPATPGSLFVSVSGEESPAYFAPGTPPEALAQLLRSYAPEN